MNQVNGLGLGATDWGGLIQAGAGIFDSVLDSRTAKLSNESAERQLQLQIQAQQEQAVRESEQFHRYLKLGLIGGGIIIAGIVVAKIM